LLSLLLRAIIATIFGASVIVGGILLWDVYTYSKRQLSPCASVPPLSLHPRTGGPKNLPILEANLDDLEDDVARKINEKPRIVILGGGWGVSQAMRARTWARAQA
jgi:NADH dehydrogenase